MKPVIVEYPDWDAVETDTYKEGFTSSDAVKGYNREPMESDNPMPRNSVVQRSRGKERTS